MIQTHPVRTCKRWDSVDRDFSLGSWLLSFFELYGTKFNYAELGIYPHPEAHYFRKEDEGMLLPDRPYLLCVKCPFESTASRLHDCGRNTYNIMKIKSAFEYAFYALLRALRDDDEEKKKRRQSLLGLLVGIR